MRIIEITEGVGLIVKGVNTTVDVGPNEIKTQAAKFGNTVDKDGVPPTLSKQVKGKSTNVLFNLGMAEATKLELPDINVGDEVLVGKFKNRKAEVKGFSKDDHNQPVLKTTKGDQKLFKPRISKLMSEGYKLQLERDKELLVLNITDTATGKRTEVRGKAGYESGGYDAKDKLHQLLDRVGKSANISELINGEVVTINPKHPDGAKAKAATDAAYNESNLFTEALGELDPSTEIYVDMDGVLADFFGEWSKLMGVNNWKEIKDIPNALAKIRATDDFWLNLPVLPEAKQLLSLIKQVKGEYNICTSPLADDPNSEPHKRKWIEKNLAFFPPKNIHITHNKPQYATNSNGTPNILIDDFGKNINAWEAAGGIGFKYKDHKFERTAKAIKQHMQEPATEAVAVEPHAKGYQKDLLTSPKYTLVVDTPGDLDWYKLGHDIANLDQADPHEYGQGDSDVTITSASEEEMQKLMKQLDRLGLNYKAIGGTHDQPEIHGENFADGKKPGRKGLAKRSGVNTKASVSSLRKTAKSSSGEKQRMAHWLANMKAGKAKKK